MNNDPLISVIVPVYNVEKYLKHCVDSVLSQTYTNLEVILVDDGSTDGSPTICDNYKNKDRRVNVIHKENGGLSDARNSGIDICKGEYISFIDSDDFVSPLFIESLYDGIVRYNSDLSTLVHSNTFYDGKDYFVKFTDDKKKCSIRLVSADDAMKYMLYQQISNGSQMYLYKRKIFDELRFPKGYLYEDLYTTYKALLKSKKVTLVYADAYAYRIRANSIIRMKFDQRKMVCIDITRNMYKDICKKKPKLKKAAASRAFAINYHVFLQVPLKDSESMKKLWREIIKYRRIIIFDMRFNSRIKNRIGAVVTYLGMKTSWRIGRKLTNKTN